jgi:hypothetical protein
MKIIKNKIYYIFTLLILILNVNNSYSQTIQEIKYTLNTKFNKLELPEIIDLIQNYKNDEIEIMTLQMEKIGQKDRFITGNKIYFGNNYQYGERIEDRLKYYDDRKIELGDLYFTKTQSPKLNDRYKSYYTLNIYIDKETLYKTIIEIGNKEEYKFISTKTVQGGVQKIFEFIPIDKRKGFLIQTFDGDRISKISFLLNY